MGEKQLHVVLVPFSAFGHMMPFFQLSIALAKFGVRVSYISTPRNIERLPKVPHHLSSLIDFVAFPLPKHPLLPDGAEATVDIPFDKGQYLKIAYDQLQEPVRRYVEQTSPDWIVVDFCPHWAVEISQDLHVPLLFFYVFCAAFLTFMGPPEFLDGPGRERVRPGPESLMKKPEWIDFPCSIACRGYEAVRMHPGFYGSNASGLSDAARNAKILSSCKAVAIRSCCQFEGEYLKLYEKLLGKTVIPTGLLPPEKPQVSPGADHGPAWSECFKWLDRQQPKSVVFVGFGSETKLAKEHVREIARGLELSELPFLWALRINPADEEDGLPSGFLDRTSGRGKVCFEPWSPQMQILAHPSVGGSLFHSGWGSVIETLQFGHALVVLPFIIDQGSNARFLAEKGLAVEIERAEDGSFTGESIGKSLKLAMVSEEGEGLRARAREAAVYFGDQKLHQEHYIGQFVEFLKKNGADKTEKMDFVRK